MSKILKMKMRKRVPGLLMIEAKESSREGKVKSNGRTIEERRK